MMLDRERSYSLAHNETLEVELALEDVVEEVIVLRGVEAIYTIVRRLSDAQGREERN
jgi:hypothetical protein